MSKPKDRTIDGLDFVLTCPAFPEQYDVYRGADEVGYVRLRHGCLRVDAPFGASKLTLEGIDCNGQFIDEEQRAAHLKMAADAINREIGA